MIRIKDIIKWSNPHSLEGGKITRLYNKEIEFSIVGGRSGLYGDFVDDFDWSSLLNQSDKTTKELMVAIEEINEVFDLFVTDTDLTDT